MCIRDRVGSVSGSSSTNYCDIYYISTASGRVVYRGVNGANPNGGVSMSGAVNGSSNASAYIGSRLAFRGRLVRASSVCLLYTSLAGQMGDQTVRGDKSVELGAGGELGGLRRLSLIHI